MNLGQLLGGAGVVGQGMRQAEEAERVARQNQLAIEAQNRQEQLRREMLQAPMPSPVGLTFGVNSPLPMRMIDTGAVPVPGQMPLPAGVQPSQAGAGRGVVNPPLVGQPQPPIGAGAGRGLVNPPLIGEPQPQPPSQPYQDLSGFTPPAGMTGPQNLAALRDARMQRFAAPAAPATAPRAVPAVVPRAGPAVAPNKAAQKYDAKTTPYDALIAQSAQQYGVDPVIFKRLIGTESSFSPTAVSPRGEKFGLGIAQIADVHPLTREQRLDPNTAIPFAAQLFAQYLQEAGNNYEQAIQKYKGASSAGGKAAMSGPIGTILSGIVSSAQAAAPGAAPAAPVAPQAGVAIPTAAAPQAAPAPVRAESDYYLANRDAIPVDMQRAMQQRAEVERLAGMYQRAGMGAQFMEMRAKLMELDNGMTYLHGMQGIQEFEVANDPRRLAAVWSQYAGVPIGIQPRSDGKFDIIVNGKRTREGLSDNDVVERARLGFDQTYRQQKGAASAKYNEEAFKVQLEIQKANATQLSQMVREIAVERVKGNSAQALEWAKANYGWDIKPTGSGDGTVIIRAPGAAPFLFNPTGKTVSPDGVKIESNAAYPIQGLPSYGGVQTR